MSKFKFLAGLAGAVALTVGAFSSVPSAEAGREFNKSDIAKPQQGNGGGRANRSERRVNRSERRVNRSERRVNRVERRANRAERRAYEKFITDMEVLQMVAELCTQTSCGVDDIALDALREVQPGGHFFSAAHTMDRYQTAFYEPMASDWSNFGIWTERGSMDSNERATGTWQSILNDFTGPELDGDRAEQLMASIRKRTAAGSALPES